LAGRDDDATACACPSSAGTSSEADTGIPSTSSYAGASFHPTATGSTVLWSFPIFDAWSTEYGAAFFAAACAATSAAATRTGKEEKEEEECRSSGAAGGYGWTAPAAYGATCAAYGPDCAGSHGTTIYGGKHGQFFGSYADAYCCTCPCCTSGEAKEGGTMLEMRQ
jgi:hypothetical protein